ncbi:unnamed protein product [Sympodiomycopsis kandeliae]
MKFGSLFVRTQAAKLVEKYPHRLLSRRCIQKLSQLTIHIFQSFVPESQTSPLSEQNNFRSYHRKNDNVEPPRN